MGKKKYTFQVCLELVDLSNVALRNEFIFVKIRQKDGGKLSYLSSKAEVKDHRVLWNEKISFKCKTQANASTGILNECYLRFSIRKETRLGATYKLGFVDVNLSEYAGCGRQSGKYLLEGYTSSTRLDNSILKFFIDMQLISGDPLFKRHTCIADEEALTHNQLHHHIQQQQFQHHPQQTHLDDRKLADSTRVNNDVAINEIIEQNLLYASSVPIAHKGLSLHDIKS